MHRTTLFRWIAALLPAVVLPALAGLFAPVSADADDPAAAVAALAPEGVGAAVTRVTTLAADPAFASLAPTLGRGLTTTKLLSAAEAALLARIHTTVRGSDVVAVAEALRSAAAGRNHADYWYHFARAQQHAGYTVGGATAIAGVWTVLVVPGIQRCGADANCVAFWVLLGAGLSAAGASYTAFEGVATALEAAAFAQSAGSIGYALVTWVVVCVYAGQQCDRPPV